MTAHASAWPLLESLRRYRFRTEWVLDASPADTYGVLQALAGYPGWWPEVRRVEQIEDGTAHVVVRSVLPYDLVVITRREREDAAAGVLEARLSGDLSGWSRWTVLGSRAGSTAVFEEEVLAEKALLRRLGAVARPAFRANHALMMASGRRGLGAFLAGQAHGRAGA